MDPQIVLRWATRADIPSILEVLHANLLHFELHDHIAPERRQHPEEFARFLIRRIKLFFIKPETRYMVAETSAAAIDGTQQTSIIGFSTWEAQGNENPLGRRWRQQRASWTDALEASLVNLDLIYYRYFLNRIVDYQALAEIAKRLHAPYENDDQLRNCLHLQFLMVDPAWHRAKGVGKRLLQWGMEAARQFDLPVVVESSLLGYEFYLKHGFTLFAKARIDIVPAKAYDMPIVVHWPEKKGQ
ncbi:hypothetical protein CERZMDRAFT_96957 [Cercospora zeae-maydis SCOH1-5]|uniref:N-acetyltransferase domain-containing protein n=1 Tax=Cercospora zeae-maydis SCOH1-5 TaxID=717836 RepID=A0A6A6FJ92_9PEZI|nr:hypothetical protein CERZMDRAFT_96957 [Cercospora zeae-maydis SCOH1-5]